MRPAGNDEVTGGSRRRLRALITGFCEQIPFRRPVFLIDG
jgi:hypothetical protein